MRPREKEGDSKEKVDCGKVKRRWINGDWRRSWKGSCLWRMGTKRIKRRGASVLETLYKHQRKACNSCSGVYSGFTQPNSLHTCSSALPSEPKGLSVPKREKKCWKMECDQSNGEAKHSISRAK